MLAFYFILIALFCLGFIFDSESFLPLGWSLLIISIIGFFIFKKKRGGATNNWFNPSYLLLLCIIIVSLQTIINVMIGLAPFSTYMSATYQPYICKATYIGFISIVSYLLGNSLRIKPVQIRARWRKDYALIPWLILLLVFFVLFVRHIDLASFISGRAYVGSGGYNRVMETSAYYEQLLGVSLVIVTSIVTYRNLGKSDKISLRSFLCSYPIVFWVVLILYVLLRMLSGDRGPVLQSLCLVFYSYLMCSKRKFKIVTVVGLIIVAAMFTTLLGIVRGGDLNQSFIERVENASLASEGKKPSVLSATQELANSVNTEFIALKASDDSGFEYSFGKYTFFALIGSIPGSSYVLSKVFDVNLRETMSAEYVTVYHFGRKYGFGLGTSPMAEYYLELGIVGVIVGFIFLGWLFNHLDLLVFKANARTPLWLIIITLRLSSGFMSIARSSVPGWISKAIYTLIIFLVLNAVFQLFCSRKSKLIITN